MPTILPRRTVPLLPWSLSPLSPCPCVLASPSPVALGLDAAVCLLVLAPGAGLPLCFCYILGLFFNPKLGSKVGPRARCLPAGTSLAPAPQPLGFSVMFFFPCSHLFAFALGLVCWPPPYPVVSPALGAEIKCGGWVS